MEKYSDIIFLTPVEVRKITEHKLLNISVLNHPINKFIIRP